MRRWGIISTKKSCPSYRYHSFLIGGLRLPLEVEARPGTESHGVHGAEALWRLLDRRLRGAPSGLPRQTPEIFGR